MLRTFPSSYKQGPRCYAPRCPYLSCSSKNLNASYANVSIFSARSSLPVLNVILFDPAGPTTATNPVPTASPVGPAHPVSERAYVDPSSIFRLRASRRATLSLGPVYCSISVCDHPESLRRDFREYTRVPPVKYLEAPGMATRYEEMSPPQAWVST